jgi:hypothetical protein
LGSSEQTDEQKADLDIVFNGFTGNYRSLDYVCGWFVLGGEYIKKSNNFASYAFVSTNSIVQGIHPPALAATINGKYAEIFFGHTSFTWKNNASKNAAVIVVIIGVRKRGISNDTKFLITGNVAIKTDKINSYLLPLDELTLSKSSKSISKLPLMDYGSKPVDGGYLILSEAESKAMITDYPDASEMIFPYLGSHDYINGISRYCLWIDDKDLSKARQIPPINERLIKVSDFRKASKKTQTSELSETPHLFGERRRFGSKNILIIPSVSSERRRYLPVGYVPDTSVVSNSSFAMNDVPKWCFSLIVSKLHLCWIATVCGKLKNDYRYSNTLGWNTFPVPDLSDENKAALTKCAEEILLARDHYFENTIAELYDPKNMEKKFPELWEAHERSDVVLETIYNGQPFQNDTERLEHLFARYVKMTSKPLGKKNEGKK